METATEQVTTTQEHPDAVIEDASAESGPSQSLFGEKLPTEAELMGEAEDTSSTEKTSEEEKGAAASKPEDEKKAEEDKPSEGEKAEAEKAAEEGEKPKEGEEDKKPPDGYVEIQALHEERDKRKDLNNAVANLQGQVIQLNQALARAKEGQLSDAESKADDGFEVLTEEEFKELAEEDPSEATIYLKNLQEHKDTERQFQAQLGYEAGIIDQSWKNMSDAIEGFADPENSIRKDLTEFALKRGFSNEDLSAMTSPGTLVMAPGEKKLRVLGKGAAEIVKLIHQLYQAGKKPTRGTAITEPASSTPRSGGKANTFSEQQYAKMSPKERESLLGG